MPQTIAFFSQALILSSCTFSLMATSCGLVLACVAVMIAMAGAIQFRVGGSKGWSVPDPGAMSYNQWAERNRFRVGDSLRKQAEKLLCCTLSRSAKISSSLTLVFLQCSSTHPIRTPSSKSGRMPTTLATPMPTSRSTTTATPWSLSTGRGPSTSSVAWKPTA